MVPKSRQNNCRKDSVENGPKQTTATNMAINTSILSAHRRETQREGGVRGPIEREKEREREGRGEIRDREN